MPRSANNYRAEGKIPVLKGGNILGWGQKKWGKPGAGYMENSKFTFNFQFSQTSIIKVVFSAKRYGEDF